MRSFRCKAARRQQTDVSDLFGFGVFWSPLGPSPIPNGQTLGAPPELPVNGLVTAIAIDPHDSNVVYVAGAQGGVFRTLDGRPNLVGTNGWRKECRHRINRNRPLQSR
jgi:hypothetical protein